MNEYEFPASIEMFFLIYFIKHLNHIGFFLPSLKHQGNLAFLE